MAIFFIDGFDKYGSPVQTTGAGVASTFYSNRLQANMSGEWNSTSDAATANASVWIDAGLSTTGYSIGFSQANVVAGTISKTLPANYSRLIGGYRFKQSSLSGLYQGIEFKENANVQARICVDASGHVFINSQGGITTAATSTASIGAATTHYLEWDITFADVGSYTIWLDGVQILTGTADFKASTNAYCNSIRIGAVNGNANGGATLFIDDLYLDDGTGSALLSNPAIETTLMSSDTATAQFSSGNSIIGDYELLTNASNAPGANFLFLRKFTPSVSGSLASVSCMAAATSSTAKYKAVVYSDSSGSPNALLATGAEVIGTGTVAYNVAVTSSLASPPSLTAGTAYWIGFITDTSVALMVTSTSTTTGVKIANTYTSGAPGTAGAVTTGQSNWALWGSLTGVTSHTYDLAQAPAFGFGSDYNYVQSATVGNEDLMNVAGLVSNPATIYTVAVKGVFRDSDAGARTVTLQQKSSSTDSASTAFSPSTSYQWFAGYWATDPNGSIAWTKTNLNNALAGYKIAS